WPQSVDNALGDPPVSHGCPLALARKPCRGNTGETPKRKPWESHGTRILSEMPITSSFWTVQESWGTPRNWPSLEWHSRGQGFDSPWLHQLSHRNACILFVRLDAII